MHLYVLTINASYRLVGHLDSPYAPVDLVVKSVSSEEAVPVSVPPQLQESKGCC